MRTEHSAGAIIFRETKNGREYLLLQHPNILSINSRNKNPIKGHWAFPKGHVEKGEKTEDTIKREVQEETGIEKIEFIAGFSAKTKYLIGPMNNKRIKYVIMFLARTQQGTIKLSDEHQAYAWLPYDKALAKATHRDSKNMLKKADAFLSSR